MNTPTPTPTPRTDAAWASSFEPCEYRAAHTARIMRECSQQLETELNAATAERDQLRAIFPQICAALGNGAFCTPTVSVGFIESIPNEVQLVVAALRAKLERLRSDRDCEKRLRKDADEFREDAIARAARAEDNLAALEQCHDDNCRGVVKIADELATERARLDWLESPAGMDWQWQAGITRATIDAKMQKEAK